MYMANLPLIYQITDEIKYFMRIEINIVNEINFFTRHCYVIQQIFSKIFIDYQ